ncbi:hypothetical protein LOC71_19070 [Rhodopirellula sp. JC740]|uniref:Uncharacterized protein n=1 Tax=Rhodopirellula halodulae TaxID=2894198 RepID=A0ABS8NLE9_9BACT|nr:hypothetical protein [Rhodopirellula sp. JC740]MCC9644380.1 hypothetical protein [Rhodopirellula sp. JC740]
MSLKSRAQNASRVTLGACLVSLTLSGGCASMTKSDSETPKKSLMERMPWAKKETAPEPYPNPAKLAAVWSTESLTQVGRVPTRGFGGRIFFYDEKSRAVPVDGTLVIHGFDEGATDPKGAVKRFEFTPEQLTSHFSQSDVGASYSIWVPWDAIGGEQSQISLVASFRTEEGKMLQGQPTTVLLPGSKGDEEMDLARRYSPDFRAWKQAAAGNTTPTSGLTTTTISRPTTPTRAGDTPTQTNSTWNIARNQSKALDIAMVNQSDAPENSRSTNESIAEQPGKPQVLPASTRLNH